MRGRDKANPVEDAAWRALHVGNNQAAYVSVVSNAHHRVGDGYKADAVHVAGFGGRGDHVVQVIGVGEVLACGGASRGAWELRPAGLSRLVCLDHERQRLVSLLPRVASHSLVRKAGSEGRIRPWPVPHVGSWVVWCGSSIRSWSSPAVSALHGVRVLVGAQ